MPDGGSPPSAALLPVGGPPGVEQTVDDGVGEGLPGSGDDVLGHPDGGPGAVAVGRVDEDPSDRSGSLGRVEHPYAVVDQVDPGEGRVAGGDGGAAGPVRGLDRPVSF